MTEAMNEINDELTRIREDALAKSHCGYFKLWKMELSSEERGNWGCLPWVRDKLLGVFSSREPCEEFLELIEHGPWATYSFHTFHHDLDHVSGYWAVEVNENGVTKTDGRLNFPSPKWEWGWGDTKPDYESKNCRGSEAFRGHARTKARALALALEAKADYEEFVRVERPKRAEGCRCDPWDKKPCGKCEKAEAEALKKKCGCPHCEGDHS